MWYGDLVHAHAAWCCLKIWLGNGDMQKLQDELLLQLVYVLFPPLLSVHWELLVQHTSGLDGLLIGF